MAPWTIYVTCLATILLFNNVESYKILVTMILPGKSHGILGEGLVQHLLSGGHEVTYVTPFPPKPQKNLTIIDVSENIIMADVCNVKDLMDGKTDLRSLYVLMDIFVEIGKVTFQSSAMQGLLSDSSQKFDLIVAEWLFHDLIAGLAAVYDCPYAWFSSFEPHWMVLKLMDDMPNPAYVSNFASNNAPPFTFWERLEELWDQVYGSWLHYYYIAPRVEELYKQYIVPHIHDKSKPVPSIEELKYNASLMFGNSHASLGEATRLPQNYLAIGGYHIDPEVKPLPSDLKKIMESAEHGVIYFSMGSNLKSQDLPESLTRGLLNIFAKLKQTVIWKFERDLPNRPKNVHIVHWAPQQSILAHPKTLFFISHGGLLSTTESVHFGVPMISIPVMVDQFVNADRAVKKGYAIKVDLSYTMENNLEKAIQTMLTDPKYKNKAKELEFIYHNRPLTPRQEILHWVDHVIKTRGALHLRSPGLQVPWYQKLYLDLLAIILVIVLLLTKIAKIMTQWTIWFLLTSLFLVTQAHKILVVITLPGKSHGILGDGLVRHLLNGGHEVTFITPFPPKPQKNLTIIDVSDNSKALTGGVLNIQNMMKGDVDLQSTYMLMDIGLEIGRYTFTNDHVQKMLRDHNQSFDLIITEWLFHELYSGFSAVFDCPYIWFSSMEPHWKVLRLIDQIPNPAYVSGITSNNAPPLSFWERIEELVGQIHGLWLNFFVAPRESSYYETYITPHIKNRGKSIPTLNELKHNASLMFGNSHVSLGGALRLPQNYIPIGGFHIRTDVIALPDSLQTIMDNAEHGVIYFSLGSNLRSEDLPEDLTRGILQIFGDLKQTVIWKFEKDLPNRPRNVHIVHWAPQQSILAHPNTRIFISHGGLLSTTESVHFAVPMICIPVMVDQFANVNRAIRRGFAIKVDLSIDMDKHLAQAIQTMLNDPRYAVKAKELSFIYHDRIAPPGQEILHWIDHVVKTRGATHLRSPALQVPCPLAGKSHAILGDGVVKHLINKGHEITYITAYPNDNKPHPNVTYIDVSSNADMLKEYPFTIKAIMDKEVNFQDITMLLKLFVENGKRTLANPNVQNMLKDKTQRFDAVISEWMFTEVYAGFSAVYQCPLIWLSTVEPHWMVLQIIDEAPNPSYTPDCQTYHVPPFNFWQRVVELLNIIFGRLIQSWLIHGPEQQYYEEYLVPYIEDKSRPIPTIDALRYNGSLMLGNSHFSLGQPTRLPQNYIPIAGYHIDREVKPLPKDLQTIMDNAKHGVIYFSMGSNLKSKDFPEDLKNGILKFFGELKQTIIWKFEDDQIKNKPNNLHILKWAPQQSILAHPNCVLFITHGGLLSTTEAIHYGVPLLGIPVFADQFTNVARAVHKGFARKVPLSYTMMDDFKEQTKHILQNPKYAAKAKELSLIYHSRVVPPGVELVHWVEHVVETGGAAHLRSPALDMPVYQKYYLDLISVILVIVASITYIVRTTCKRAAKKPINMTSASHTQCQFTMWGHLLLVITLVITSSHGYRILVAFPMPSRSHSILGDGLVNALVEAKHQVTYITPFPKNVGANIRTMDVSENKEVFPDDDISNINAIMNKEKDMQNITFFVTSMSKLSEKTIENPEVHKMLNDPNEHFDIVIIEWMFYELLAGFSAVFNCPYIWVSSADPHWRALKLVDDFPNPAYTPDAISTNFPPFTFIQRVQELIFQIGGMSFQHFTLIPMQIESYEKFLVPIIEKRGNKAPAFRDLMFNASLVLSNSHVSVGKSVRLPQNFIPVGGYHISRDVKPLPENLKKLLDNAKNGLIYFSMGSNLKSKHMPVELKKSLLSMFSKLKYTILWKFEEDLPGTPDNVQIVKWAPQQSILAHPNCILFVTHGGLLSTTETIHFGKPIVAIPVFADQFNNANLAVIKGFAKKVDLSYTMADDLRIAIEDVLQDPKYAKKAKELSVIYHDRPVTPDKEVVHWIEHVVRTGGARHLRSPALDPTWYQKLYLDLVAITAEINFADEMLLALLVLCTLAYCDAYKILVVYPMPSRSHSILGDKLVNVLVKAGHEITYITPFPKGITTIKEIDISDNKQYLPDGIKDLKSLLNKEISVHNSTVFTTLLPKIKVNTIENKDVERLMNDPNEHFDVIIIEYMFCELLAGITPVQNKEFERLFVPVIRKRGNTFNLKKLLDESKNGLIYFSMGSNLKSKYLPDEVEQSLLNMFGKLKYTVLWKFEDNLHSKPSNVHMVQWAPQDSILG
ncbi:unnamed protein product [Leptosia nina]|uniref:Uncharacterized protein n=1 Tax=Leptosia nina TaxID=320188 RepID=A0AAV1J7P2_9NEOP